MPYRLNGSFLSSCLLTARAPDRRDEVASSRSRPRLRTKAYHIPLDACCTAANLGWQCPLWVISVISKRGTDVGFTPDSGRDSDLPGGRYVPEATEVRRSNILAIQFDASELVLLLQTHLALDANGECEGKGRALARL